MKKIITVSVILSLILFYSCSQDKQKEVKTLYSFNELEPLINKNNDTVHILNFWATWCKPCVKELPYFEKINYQYKYAKVRTILVSLDFSENKDNLVIPFLKEKNIKSEVIILDDPDANSWIDKVNPDWSGSIPATLIYKGNQKYFHEGIMDYNTLDSIVKSKLK